MGIRGVVHGLRGRGNNSGQGFMSNRLAAVIGDSLTERAFGSTPWYWQNALIGAPVKLIANSGHQGQSVFGLKSQFATDYKASTAPGFANLPPLGLAGVRIGTNTYRFGAAFTSTGQDDYMDVLDNAKSYAEHVIVFPVPPIGGGGSVTKNTIVPVVNEWLQGVCDADPRLHWVDDCADLTDNDGNILPQYFDVDELHMNGAGSLQMAITAKPALETLMAQLYGPSWSQSRLVTDAADVYPAQPQWTTNPTNVGVGGTFGSGWSGQAPNGWRVANNGSGIGGTVSIEPADEGDANQVPWVRITPNASSASAQIAITMTGDGRTITSGDPAELEQMIEVRGNSFTQYEDLTLWLQSGGSRLTPNARLRWGPTIGLNQRGTLQQSHYRTTGSAGTPTNYIYLASTQNYSGSMGSLDLRCWSVRG